MTSIAKLKDKARKHEQKENWQAAIAVYQKVLDQQDENENLELDLGLYNRIGDLNLRIGQTDEAVSYYEKAADKYAESGFYNNAIALCNKALRHRPDRAAIYLKLSRLCTEQGFQTDARRWILEYAERKVAAGEIEDALTGLEEFAELSEDPEIREMLAQQLASHGRPEEAIGQLRTAYAMRVRAGRADQAAAVAERAREIDPDVDLEAEDPVPLPELESGDGVGALGAGADAGSRTGEPAGAAEGVETAEEVEGAGVADDIETTVAEVEAPAEAETVDGLETGGEVAAEADAEAVEGLEPGTGVPDEAEDESGVEEVQGLEGLESTGAEVEADEDTAPDVSGLEVSYSEQEPAGDEEAEAGAVGGLETFDRDRIGGPGAGEEPADAAGVAEEPAGDLVAEGVTGEPVGGEGAEGSQDFESEEEAEPLPLLATGYDEDDEVAEDAEEELAEDEVVAGEPAAGEDLAGEDLAGEDLAEDEFADEEFADEEVTEEELAEPVEVQAQEADAEEADEAEEAIEAGPMVSAEAEAEGAGAEPIGAVDSADLAEAEVDRGAEDEVGFEDEVEVGTEAEAPEPVEEAGPVEDVGSEEEAEPVEEEAEPVEEEAEPVEEEVEPVEEEVEPVEEEVGPGEVAAEAEPVEDAAVEDAAVEVGSASEGFETTAVEGEAAGESDELDLSFEQGEPLETEPDEVPEYVDVEGAFDLDDMDLGFSMGDDESGEGPVEDLDIDATLERARSLVSRALTDQALRELNLLSAAEAEPEAFEDALAVVNEVLRHNPNDMEALQRRVEYAERIGDRQLQVDTHLDLAEALERVGSETKARAVYRRALELDPSSEVAREALGAADEDGYEDEDQDAVDLNALVREMAPEGLEEGLEEGLGEGLGEQLGEAEDSDPDFAAMLDQFRAKVAENVSPEDADDHYDLGLAFREMGLIDEAIAEFQTALTAGEERLKVYEELGQCFVQKGQYNVAVKVFERGLKVPHTEEDELLGVYYHLGQCYEELGRREDARGAYEKVLSIDRTFADVPDRVARL